MRVLSQGNMIWVPFLGSSLVAGWTGLWKGREGIRDKTPAEVQAGNHRMELH
jgi:hypothetical protein